MLNRRHILKIGALTLSRSVVHAEDAKDPWSSAELLEPADLAKKMASGEAQPAIFCVAFPILYSQRHIAGARYAGPGNKPEGIQSLRAAVAKLPKNSEIVVYCGCCPMVKCPNIRPSYSALKTLGFSKIRVLSIPTNFHADWSEKGYPVEPAKQAAL